MYVPILKRVLGGGEVATAFLIDSWGNRQGGGEGIILNHPVTLGNARLCSMAC